MTNRQHQQHSDHREGGAAWDVQHKDVRSFGSTLNLTGHPSLTTTAGGDLGGLFEGEGRLWNQ